MRALMVGDAHGSNRFMSTVILKHAVKYKPDVIIQLGDFGYWEHFADGVDYLDRTESKLAQINKTMFILDGNHENHPLLWAKYPPREDGFCEVRPHILYMPRGHRFTWEGVRFLALGGAYSIDEGWRKAVENDRNAPGTLWWPTETITAEQAYKAKEGGEVDVMLTHDSPWGVAMGGIKGEFWQSNENRRVIRDVLDHVRPKWLFHGHYHRWVDTELSRMLDDDAGTWESTRIIGLSFEGMMGSVKVVDFAYPIEDTHVHARP